MNNDYYGGWFGVEYFINEMFGPNIWEENDQILWSANLIAF